MSCLPPSRCLATALLALSTLGAHAASPAPAARLFDPVKDADARLGPAWRTQACALLPQPCEAASLQLVRERGEARPDAYVLLARTPLARAELRRTADGWVLGALRDFSGYRHQGVEPGVEGELSLSPALYPLGEGRWAVAVLATVSEMYSGGGARFDRADFVPLDAPSASTRAVHADVPFYCSKMVRACFSEKEYKTSPHCHDESTGSLRIAYGAAARASGDYRWDYTWIETTWPAHRKPSAATRVATRFTDGRAGEVPFCGGPQ